MAVLSQIPLGEPKNCLSQNEIVPKRSFGKGQEQITFFQKFDCGTGATWFKKKFDQKLFFPKIKFWDRTCEKTFFLPSFSQNLILGQMPCEKKTVFHTKISFFVK